MPVYDGKRRKKARKKLGTARQRKREREREKKARHRSVYSMVWYSKNKAIDMAGTGT